MHSKSRINFFYKEKTKYCYSPLLWVVFHPLNWTLTQAVIWFLLALPTVSRSITVTKLFGCHVALLISHSSREVLHNFVSYTCWTGLNSTLKHSWAYGVFHCISFPQLPWHWWLKSSRGIQVFQVAGEVLLWIRTCVINPGQVRNLFYFNNVTH